MKHFFQIKDYLKQFCVNKVCLLSLKNTAYLTRGTKQYKLVGKPQVSFSVSLMVVHIQLKNITNCILFSCAQLDQSRLFSSTLQTKYDTELKLVLKWFVAKFSGTINPQTQLLLSTMYHQITFSILTPFVQHQQRHLAGEKDSYPTIPEALLWGPSLTYLDWTHGLTTQQNYHQNTTTVVNSILASNQAQHNTSSRASDDVRLRHSSVSKQKFPQLLSNKAGGHIKHCVSLSLSRSIWMKARKFCLLTQGTNTHTHTEIYTHTLDTRLQ